MSRDDQAAPGGDGPPPDETHGRPPGVDDRTVKAVGMVTEALEWVERARGRLFDLHHMIGRADFLLGDAADLLDECGRPDLAQELRRDIVGRNVLDGRWTFQIVEEFEEVYYQAMRAAEEHVRRELVAGRRHLHEAELKEARRTPGVLGHESRPPGRRSGGG